MGQSAEKMAQENGISREAQDRWALRSHQLAWAATEDGRLTREIAPVYVDGVAVTRDNGIRADTSLEKLAAAEARLRPEVRHGHGRQRLAPHRRRLRRAADERGEGEGARLRAARLHPLLRLRRPRPRRPAPPGAGLRRPGGAGARRALHEGHRPHGHARGLRRAGALQPAVAAARRRSPRSGSGSPRPSGMPDEDRINVHGRLHRHRAPLRRAPAAASRSRC